MMMVLMVLVAVVMLLVAVVYKLSILHRGLINCMDTKIKMPSSKKIVFIDRRLAGDTVSHVGIFNPSL